MLILRGPFCLVNVVMDELLNAIQFRSESLEGFSIRFSRSAAHRLDHPAFIVQYATAELGLVKRREVLFPLRRWRTSLYEGTQKLARWILNYSIDLIT